MDKQLLIFTPVKSPTADDVIFITDSAGTTVATLISHGTSTKADAEGAEARARLKAAADAFVKGA